MGNKKKQQHQGQGDQEQDQQHQNKNNSDTSSHNKSKKGNNDTSSHQLSNLNDAPFPKGIRMSILEMLSSGSVLRHIATTIPDTHVILSIRPWVTCALYAMATLRARPRARRVAIA